MCVVYVRANCIFLRAYIVASDRRRELKKTIRNGCTKTRICLCMKFLYCALRGSRSKPDWNQTGEVDKHNGKKIYILCIYENVYSLFVVVVVAFVYIVLYWALRLCIHMHIYNNEHRYRFYIYLLHFTIYAHFILCGIFMLSTLQCLDPLAHWSFSVCDLEAHYGWIPFSIFNAYRSNG